jgi:hypothetical protein
MEERRDHRRRSVGEEEVAVRLRRVAALVTALLCSSTAGANQVCNPPNDFKPRGWIESTGIFVFYRTFPETIEVGRHFTLEAIVCSADAATHPTGLRIDAVMPTHRHGMNYRPQVHAKGNGRYVAEGLLFHMPGRWRLLFDLQIRGRSEVLWQDISLD